MKLKLILGLLVMLSIVSTALACTTLLCPSYCYAVSGGDAGYVCNTSVPFDWNGPCSPPSSYQNASYCDSRPDGQCICNLEYDYNSSGVKTWKCCCDAQVDEGGTDCFDL